MHRWTFDEYYYTKTWYFIKFRNSKFMCFTNGGCGRISSLDLASVTVVSLFKKIWLLSHVNSQVTLTYSIAGVLNITKVLHIVVRSSKSLVVTCQVSLACSDNYPVATSDTSGEFKIVSAQDFKNFPSVTTEYLSRHRSPKFPSNGLWSRRSNLTFEISHGIAKNLSKYFFVLERRYL